MILTRMLSQPFVTCPQPSSPHHVIAFTLQKHMDLCFFFKVYIEKIYYKIIIINYKQKNINVRKKRIEIRSAYRIMKEKNCRMAAIFLFPLLYITIVRIAKVVHLIFSSNNI